MLDAAIIAGGLTVAAGLVFALVHRPRGKPLPDADRIDSILPQTQCGRCGYSACRPYAEAIARGEADINQCPPGGDSGIRELAELLGRQPKPLNPKHGAVPKEPIVAWIDEAACIGCTRCIQACPVDAILGAAKQMHTVIRAECTGCELCVEPCPVDCIHMTPVKQGNVHATDPQIQTREQHRRKADLARERHQHRVVRLARDRDERQLRQQRKKAMPRLDLASIDKKAVIQAAVDRARQRQAALAASRITSPKSRSE
jgi:electron transport complex protein RnfB